MRASALTLAALLAACSTPGPTAGQPTGPITRAELPGVVPLAACPPHPWLAAPGTGFRHKRSRLVIEAGSPNHAAQDVVALEGGGAVEVRGKFAYGAVSKDLEDEAIDLYLDSCQGWERIGQGLTDDDGRVRVVIDHPLSRGVYPVRLQVAGDGSSAEATVWVLARGTRLAVFDIDGTLTTGDDEIVKDVVNDLFEPLARGDYVPSAYPGAAALTLAEAARGHVIVYLTGRPYWLTGSTRAWLASGGFAPGILHVTDSNGEAVPNEGGVGQFKLGFLKRLVAGGAVVDVAYGNATTDVFAYLGAGLPAASVWIIGKHAGLQDTNAVTGGWDTTAATVRGLPKVEQP